MKFPKPKKRSLRFMSRFDALELHACVEHTDPAGETFIEQEDEVLKPTMFSVYGHLISPGGVQCLEDFKTHRAALAWMKREAARCKFELGYEDFWEHGKKEQNPTGEEIACDRLSGCPKRYGWDRRFRTRFRRWHLLVASFEAGRGS